VTDNSRQVVVGRLRKPHGLKGDCNLFPLTDDPATIFAPGQQIWVVDLAGETVAGPLTVERSRSYHREWLVKFAGVDSRDALEPFRAHFLGVPVGTLSQWRYLRIGPPAYRVGRHLRYDPAAVRTWSDAQDAYGR